MLVSAYTVFGHISININRTEHIKVVNEKDSFVIERKGDAIILKKFQPTCVFCRKLGPSVDYYGYNVCLECIEKLAAVKDEIK